MTKTDKYDFDEQFFKEAILIDEYDMIATRIALEAATRLNTMPIMEAIIHTSALKAGIDAVLNKMISVLSEHHTMDREALESQINSSSKRLGIKCFGQFSETIH
jgi:glutamate racemase